MSEAKLEEKWKPEYNPWLIAVIVTSAAFMEILDTTIVNVAFRILPEASPPATTKRPGR